jgi:uncharacterized protein (TIGR03663 family)
MRSWHWPTLAVILCLAAVLRLTGLGFKPMHADEAVHADKLGTLLDTGDYRYDPHGFHGPALPYLSLIPAAAAGRLSYQDLDEPVLRLLPAVAGLLLVLCPLLLAPVLGGEELLAAALLLAISPALVYYSRYYIPEMALALFTYACLGFAWRYAARPRTAWALLAGLAAGLAAATKETFPLALAAAGLAIVVVRPALPAGFRARDAALGCAAAVISACLLWSSFLRHPAAIAEALASPFTTYVSRGTEGPLHLHPPWFYLHLTGFYTEGGGPVFSEALILALGLAGLASARRGPPPIRFLAVFTLALSLTYSAIPYKTPWCLVQFHAGWILLAGYGAVRVASAARRPVRAALWGLIAVLAIHLAWQAWRAAGVYSADPANPYAYAHTTRDVFVLIDALDRLARVHPEGFSLRVQIVSPANLWPLPWHLRRFSRQEWSREVPVQNPPAPGIITTAAMEPALARYLYELRPPGERGLYSALCSRTVWLRPGVELQAWVEHSLAERLRIAPLPGRANPVESRSPDPI